MTEEEDWVRDSFLPGKTARSKSRSLADFFAVLEEEREWEEMGRRSGKSASWTMLAKN